MNGGRLMFKSYEELERYVEKNDVRMLDFKIVDIVGRWHHLTVPAKKLSKRIFEQGFGFDGSNYGYAKIESSDMVFIPEISTAFQDPFWDDTTLGFTGNVYDIDGEERVRSSQDPRSILFKALDHLKTTGLGDRLMIGPEFEFYVFDRASYQNRPQGCEFRLDSRQSGWNSGSEEYGNLGYNVPHKGGYHAEAPMDTNRDLRSGISLALMNNNVNVKYHHHEVGGPGQQEIELEIGDALKLADDVMLAKYFIRNTAYRCGKTATFMPKPVYGEAGNGFHVHMQLFNKGETVFADDSGYAGLSETALFFIGGILSHIDALMGVVCPSTNSYKRLVKGYEAPVAVCFGSSNRTAVIRIPAYASSREKRRFEFRALDATANPYLAYAALLLAGLDGMKNETDPVKKGYGPVEKNIYQLEVRERESIKYLPGNLSDALDSLETDRDFLTNAGVFTDAMIQNWIDIKREEVRRAETWPNPVEFELYYGL